MEKTDIAVIGSGAGGLAVSSGLAKLGFKITVIEQDEIGGSSLRSGSIPCKTLINCANVARNIRFARKMGFDCDLKAVKCGTLQDFINQKVAEIRSRESTEELERLGIKVIYGQANFVSKNVIKVGTNKIKAKKIIIATGGQKRIPALPGLKDAGFLTNESFLTNIKIPVELAILGSDSEAIEYAQAFVRLGTRVKIIDSRERILRNEDSEMAWHLRGLLEQEGVEFFTGLSVFEIKTLPSKNKKRILCLDADGQQVSIDCQEIFISQGLVPNINNLALEKAGINYNNEDGIIVDKYFRTSVKNIYALGEVIVSANKGSHVTEHQAAIVTNHIALRLPPLGKDIPIPRVIYTDPEFASVGLTEDEMLRKNIKAKILRSSFRDNDRAITLSKTQGKIKMVVAKNKILGATILGPHASEIIPQFSLAIRLEIPLEELAMNLLPYPSLSRSYKKALHSHLVEDKIMSIAKGFAKVNKVFT